MGVVFLPPDVDTDQVGFHVVYSGGSNPGEPDCTAGLQTRVIFVCNKDAKWQNEDVTFYTEVEKENCFVSCSAGSSISPVLRSKLLCTYYYSYT